jgi:methyltransferase (TIGR00027 family)
MTPPAPVSSISDTALWVAMYRAMESERPDALFRDPYARTLAGERGAEILERMPKGRQFAWPMIVRTALVDEIVRRQLAERDVDTVLNLAAGLDTRPYRLALPRSTRWIDADLPDILRFKEERMQGERAACDVEYAAVDLTNLAARRALLQHTGQGARRLLVIAEGLLVYLTREQVSALAEDLAAVPAARWWLIDLGSPRLLTLLERTWGSSLRAGNAPLIFGPPEGTAFFEPHGWTEEEYRPIFEESIRLGRSMPLARVWGFVFRFYPKRIRRELERMSGVVLLRRAGTGETRA